MANEKSILYRIATILLRFSELRERPSESATKRKDFWDKFGIITSFASSFVLALVATAFTISFQSAEQSRLDREEIAERERNARQDVVSEQQLHLRNIETVAEFLPFLTGEDLDEQSKKLALIAIQEFASTKLAAAYATAIGGTGAEEALVFIAEKPDATCRDVGIATDALNVLRGQSGNSNGTITISGDILKKLFTFYSFDVGDDELIFFAVRGAMPTSTSQSKFADQYQI